MATPIRDSDLEEITEKTHAVKKVVGVWKPRLQKEHDKKKEKKPISIEQRHSFY